MQHYVTPPKVSKELSRRQQAQAPEVRALSWRAQNRLHARFARLSARRLQRNKALVAIARELCGFIWELKERNVHVGRLFPALPNHMRLTIGKKSEMEIFLLAFKQVMA